MPINENIWIMFHLKWNKSFTWCGLLDSSEISNKIHLLKKRENGNSGFIYFIYLSGLAGFYVFYKWQKEYLPGLTKSNLFGIL